MSLASYRNPCGMSDDHYSTLDKILQKLRDASPSTADAVVRYLIDGGDATKVLAELPSYGKSLRLHVYGDSRDVFSWRTLFRDWDVPREFYQRLIRVFDAAARHAPPHAFYCQQRLGDHRGLEVLLQEASNSGSSMYIVDARKCRLPYEMFKSLAEEEGCSLDDLLLDAFHDDATFKSMIVRKALLSLPGVEAGVAKQRDRIAQLLRNGSAAERVAALETLRQSGAELASFLAEITACATASAKTVREAAEPLLAHCGDGARVELERVARDGDRATRQAAIGCLGRRFRDAARDFLRSLAEGEKHPATRDLILAALGESHRTTSMTETGTPATGTSTTVQDEIALPAERPLDLHSPISPALRTILDEVRQQYEAFRLEHLERLNAATQGHRVHIYPHRPLPVLAADWLDRVIAMLEGREPLRDYLQETIAKSLMLDREPRGAQWTFFVHTDTQLIHAVRWLAMAGELVQQLYRPLLWSSIRFLDAFRVAHAPRVTLAELATAVAAAGSTVDAVLDAALYEYSTLHEWEDEGVWPLVWAQQAKVAPYLQPYTETGAGAANLQAFQMNSYRARWDHESKRNGALRLLAKCPAVPPLLIDSLWNMAIGTSKQDRQRAQPICGKLPDLPARLSTALERGNAHVRQVAAEWAGRTGVRSLIEPLTAAAEREKQDLALDAQLTALERLGEPIERFLNRDKLQTEAVKNLKKGLPSALDWFPWSALPALRWRDGDQPVPEETARWLLVQSFKHKSPEPGALLKRYCQMLRPEDRAALGDFVLSAWLAQDLKRKLTDAEARAKAQQLAAQQWPYYQSLLARQSSSQPNSTAGIPQSLQECEDLAFAQFQREVGTAVAEKGILAVAGACCGDSAVSVVAAYLKEWYGYRAAQCKALIAMLSAVDRPLAIQYLLSISNRFRTKGIREEAEKYVQLLAERKGWTLDELADRTMPTCGLDDHGRLTLDFGPRQFVARVDTRLEPHLYDADGKPLKKLPDPRQDDDPQLAAAAKKTWSACKTELKKFLDLTAGRMYEAMCTERRWPLADWKTFLFEHPLAKFLCQRLVWAADRDGGPATTFRPLDDGTLTDCDDNALELPLDVTIRVAHALHVPRELRDAWTRHCADYDVTPLFPQFAREPFELPEGRGGEQEFQDYTGYLLEAFKLRGLATKLGYVRGAAEDGGWFYEYLKSFPGLGIDVHLGFSGNGLPEENRTVALTGLKFERRTDPAAPQRRSRPIALKDVPKVLLSECVGDLRALAAVGGGFDPEWERKVRI